jgi:branched-chain amino acid aminotransferase
MGQAVAFGTEFADPWSIARWTKGVWEGPKTGPVEALSLHPGAHALHYGSSCFEGLKAHRGHDGAVRIFRLDRHVRRLQDSAAGLVLPVPPAEMVAAMIIDVVRASQDEVPAAPGSLYLRPTLIGSEANIGAASRPAGEALLFVIASPVGDYFEGGARPLSLAIETERPRTTPQFGRVKTGANYAMALATTMEAASTWGADQVLFAPGGLVQETGASNFLLLDDERIVTPTRTEALLNGVTLDSVLTIASGLGYVIEERPLGVEEVLAWACRSTAEAALSGTAAVMAGVGRLFHRGQEFSVGTGLFGPNTARLRQALIEVQRAERPAPADWLTPVH